MINHQQEGEGSIIVTKCREPGINVVVAIIQILTNPHVFRM